MPTDTVPDAKAAARSARAKKAAATRAANRAATAKVAAKPGTDVAIRYSKVASRPSKVAVPSNKGTGVARYVGKGSKLGLKRAGAYGLAAVAAVDTANAVDKKLTEKFPSKNRSERAGGNKFGLGSRKSRSERQAMHAAAMAAASRRTPTSSTSSQSTVSSPKPARKTDMSNKVAAMAASDARSAESLKASKKYKTRQKIDARDAGKQDRENVTQYRKSRIAAGEFKGKYYGPDDFKGNMSVMKAWRKAGSPKNTKSFASAANRRGNRSIPQ